MKEWDNKCVDCGSSDIEHDPELSGWYTCNACRHHFILKVVVLTVVEQKSKLDPIIITEHINKLKRKEKPSIETNLKKKRSSA